MSDLRTSRTVLVDNAMLSGVERLTGAAQTRNLTNIDNDILCFEKLVTAILFSDNLIAVDDYKSDFRSNRLRNFCFIDFKNFEQSEYSTLAKKAADFAQNMLFSFEGSKPSGDAISFFESLKIDPQLRWDTFVSSEYLTLSYLLHDVRKDGYERSIDTIFRNEMTDKSLTDPDAPLHSSFIVSGHSDVADVKEFIKRHLANNPSSKGQDSKGTLERLIFGYGWAAERSHFYNSVAHQFNADVMLAPLRDAFCESCCRIDYRSDVVALLDNLKNTSQNAISAILEPTGRSIFSLRLPFFTSYLISRTDDALQCIELALQLRSHTHFQECRTIFHNLQHASYERRLMEMNGILQYLDKSCSNLMKKYAVETANGLQFSVSLGIAGPSASAGGKLDTLFRAYRNRPFSRVFRNIANDMVNVERLGGLYDKLCSRIHKHEEASYTSISKTPKFMEERKSHHGRPAEL